MKSHHFLTILKGTFFSIILLSIVMGCSKKDDEEEILIPPISAFSFLPANPTTSDEVSFTNKSTNADSYQWSAAGTSFNSTDENPKFTFDTAGDFEVKLVTTNSDGINEITKTITVTEAQVAPVAAFSFSPTNPTTSNEVSFSNESTNADSYQWSAAGTSFNSSDENPTFTFDTAGDFEVKLVATNSVGTNEIIKTITVTDAQVAPVAAFSFSPTSPTTSNEVSFTNESTNADSYQWSAAGTSFNSTDENPKFTFDTTGDFEVKLVVTNSVGTNEIIKTITVTDSQVAPVAAFSFSPTNPETGQEVSFTNESTNADSYQWSAAGTTFSSTDENPTFTFDTAGDFEVKLVVTNSVGSNEIIKTITVTDAQVAPVAAFSFSPTNPETGQEISFTNESTNADSYQWSAAGTSFSSTDENPTFTFDTAGDFEVKLVVTNSVGTNEIIKTITVTDASGGGNSNSCGLPECYVEKTTTVSSGFTTTVTYSYSVVNGTKLISGITTATVGGTLETSFQYDSQGRRIKDETRIGGDLQNYIEYEYSNNDKTVRGNLYDVGGTLTSYSISEYDANMRLTRTDNYTPAGALTDYTVYSDFLSTEGSFPQLVETYDANNTITQTDEHTYQDCQLKSTVSKDGSGTVIGELDNTIDSSNLLRTSVATIYAQGFAISSTTQYVYDCD